MMLKTAIIQKIKGKYRLVSKKKDEHGKRRNLGEYDTLAGAKKRERQVQFFKHQHAEDGVLNPEEKVLVDLSDLAIELEESGKQKEADVVYKCIEELEKNTQYIVDQQLAPDRQMNAGNGGYLGGDGIAGGYSLGIDTGKMASVKQNKHFNTYIFYSVKEGKKEIVVGAILGDKRMRRSFNDDKDALLFFKQLHEDTQYNVDMIANINGLDSSSYLDGGANFSGLSDAYFYRNITNNDSIYDPTFK